MSCKHGWRERTQGQLSRRSYRKAQQPSLHFRQTRKKKKENPSPRRHHYYGAIGVNWGSYDEPHFASGSHGALGGHAAIISDRVYNTILDETLQDVAHQINITYSQTSTRFMWDNELYEEHSGMTHPMANIPISDRWEDSSVPTIVHHHVGHEYWIRSSWDVVPGQIITNQDAVQGGFVAAEYLGVVDGDHTWRSTQAYNAPRKYQTIWNQVKDWVSDDGELTADDYYQRVTGHILFRDVLFSDNVYPAVKFPGVDCILPLNRWSWNPMKWNAILKGTIPTYDDFFWDFRIHNSHLEFRLQHKTDRDGPCGTCRAFMERVPVAVGGILL